MEVSIKELEDLLLEVAKKNEKRKLEAKDTDNMLLDKEIYSRT